MPRTAIYKPLLFTTTIRSPERLKDLLNVFKKYNGKILDDKLAEKIVGEIIRTGLYRPTKLTKNIKQKIKQNNRLSDKEVKRILRDNPQNHKEAGFSKGWPSRFDTLFKFAKELGFVFYQSGKRIEFSEVGLNLRITNTRNLNNKPS